MRHDKSSLWGGLFIFLFVIGVFYLAYLSGSHQMTYMNDWAAENQLDVISIEGRYFNKGPFWYTNSDDSTTYAMKVMDKKGKERISFFNFGIFTQQQWQDNE